MSSRGWPRERQGCWSGRRGVRGSGTRRPSPSQAIPLRPQNGIKTQRRRDKEKAASFPADRKDGLPQSHSPREGQPPARPAHPSLFELRHACTTLSVSSAAISKMRTFARISMGTPVSKCTHIEAGSYVTVFMS